jgi:penicillin-binding protein 1C
LKRPTLDKLLEKTASVRRVLVTRRGAGIVLLLPVLILLAAALHHTALVTPPATVLLTDRHGEFLGEIPGEPDGELGYWRVNQTPPRVAAAALAVEDRYFHLHPGVNPGAIVRALIQDVKAGRVVSGGSTIAMQVARMQDPGPRTILKKAVEAVTAVLLTIQFGRDSVISHYLTIVPYGNRIRGIGYAARRYFDKPIEDLSWAEVAFLAAIPQAPDRMNPYDPMGRARAVMRGGQILILLHERGELTDQEYGTALKQIDTLHPPPLPRRPLNALHAILRLEKAANKARERGQLPSPPILRTTLDLQLQEEVAWEAFDAMDRFRDSGVGNAAVIVLERKTGKVLAWVGSGGYFDRERAGAIDYTAVPRQTGSTLKPFIYARALDRGLILTSSVLDDILRGPNGVENADHRFLGPLLPRFALANSRNVPASRLLQRLGLEEGYAFFGDLGLHDGSVSAEHYGLGMALGGLPVSLEDLVRGYTALANEGKVLDLIWYEGQEVRAPHRLMEEDTARLVTLFLSDPMARLPSFQRMGASEYRFPVAVKTGTSSSFRDAWTLAWSNKYLVGVWLGHPDNLPMNRVGGFKAAAPVVKRILEYLHPEVLDGLEDLSFPAPRGYKSARVCSLSGKLPGAACDRVHLEWFRPGDEPVDSCDVHLFMALDGASGQRANEKTPPDRVEVRAVTRLPARYAPWLVSAGLAFPGEEGGSLIPEGEDSRQAGLPELKGTGLVSVKILDPAERTTLMIDPEVPPDMSTIALVAEVDPFAEQVVWYVDGAPFEVADYPFTVRWPLSRGEHTFRVGIPLTSYLSEPVTVVVQ